MNFKFYLPFPIKFILLITLIILCTFTLAAQEENPKKTVIYLAPSASFSLYTRSGVSVGPGFSLGSEDMVSIGLGFLYTFELGAKDGEGIDVMEITILLRFYFSRFKQCTGPFIQLNAGAAVYAAKGGMSIPSPAGDFSAGLTAGWRFPLGNYFYLEPALRAGYPYIFGAVLSAGFRF